MSAFTNSKKLENHNVSFTDYKIDYNCCLGKGSFGFVYGVVKRPENEKGWLSYLFPYAYDAFFPANKSMQEASFLCVKVYKTSLRIFWNEDSIEFPLAINKFIRNFTELSRERETNEILQFYRVSKIKFYKSDSIYAQFKTRVHGQTLSYYLHQRFFIEKDQFLLRKTFVVFLKTILNPKIQCFDIHPDNLMYDEVKHVWEIVDGVVKEVSDTTQSSITNVDRIISCASRYCRQLEEIVLNDLSTYAKEDKIYTEKEDKEMIEEITKGSKDQSTRDGSIVHYG